MEKFKILESSSGRRKMHLIDFENDNMKFEIREMEFSSDKLIIEHVALDKDQVKEIIKALSEWLMVGRLPKSI